MNMGRGVTLTKILDKLCALFDEELERQRSVFAMCNAQGAAAREADFEELEARTQGLVVLMEGALESEKRRIHLLEWLVGHYQLAETQQTLSDLIAVVPQPWRARMERFQKEIRAILVKTQEVVERNEQFMTQASVKLDDSIQQAVKHVSGKQDGYGSRGREAKGHHRPALLNTVG